MFQDITTLLLDHKAFKDTVDIFVDRYRDMHISVVAGTVPYSTITFSSLLFATTLSFLLYKKNIFFSVPSCSCFENCFFFTGSLYWHQGFPFPSQKEILACSCSLVVSVNSCLLFICFSFLKSLNILWVLFLVFFGVSFAFLLACLYAISFPGFSTFFMIKKCFRLSFPFFLSAFSVILFYSCFDFHGNKFFLFGGGVVDLRVRLWVGTICNIQSIFLVSDSDIID